MYLIQVYTDQQLIEITVYLIQVYTDQLIETTVYLIQVYTAAEIEKLEVDALMKKFSVDSI